MRQFRRQVGREMRGMSCRRGLVAAGIMAAMMLLLAACVTVPEIRYFRVEYPLPQPGVNSPLPVTLGIARVAAPEPYHEERIIYRASPYQVEFYSRDRWESPPVEMVEDRVIEHFAASGRFQRVIVWRRGEPTDYRVETRLRRFEEVDESDGWYGLVELEYEVLDRGGRSLLRDVVTTRVQSGTRNIEGIVEALSKALQRSLEEVVSKTAATLQRAQP